MSDLLGGISFISKADLDEKRRLAKEAQARREAEEKEAAKSRREAVKAAAASGESKWIAPALEQRLGGGSREDESSEKKHKKHKHKKDKHKKEKHKKDKRADVREEPADESASSDGEADAAPAAPPPPAAVDAAPSGAGHVAADRSSAGLDWMMRAPPRAAAASAAAALLGGKAAEPPSEEAAPAAVPARIARELNPYARDGVESNQWTAQAFGAQDSAPTAASSRPAGIGDGGQSWQAKKLRRAVEEAQSSGRSLQEVCLERWGDLDNLPQLEALARGGGSAGGGRGSAAFDAHLKAQAARARETPLKPRGSAWPGDAESAEEMGGKGGKGGKGKGGKGGEGKGKGGEGKGKGGEGKGKSSGKGGGGGEWGGGKGGRGGGMMRPNVGGALSSAAAPEPPPPRPTLASLNSFASDGSFVAQFERSEQRSSFLYGGGSSAARERAASDARASEAAEEAETREADEVETAEAAEAAAARDGSIPTGSDPCASADPSAASSSAATAAAAASSSTATAAAASSSTSLPAAAPPDLANLDLNKLTAKALKAKMLGQHAEHERLTRLIAQAKADGSAAQPAQPAPAAERRAEPPAREKTVQFVVPLGAVGALIGKGGATIDALQSESGAKIRIPRGQEAEGGDERTVLISGSDAAIDAAQRLVEAKLTEEAERSAQRGGKALKREMKRKSGAPPAAVYEEVPTFDAASGQLVVQRVRVRPSQEEEEAAHLATLHEAADEPSTKRPKMVQRFDHKDGERTRYFRDDDEQSLTQLVEAERRGGAAGGRVDANLADAIARSKRFKGMDVDDEYDHDGAVEMSDAKGARQSEARRQQRAKAAAGTERKQQTSAAERAEARFSSHKQLIVAIANHVYLRVQDASPLAPAHCVIEPIDMTASLVDAADEVADEVRNFQKCLVRMLDARGQAAVFLETHSAPSRLLGLGPSKASLAVECVPLSTRDAHAAPSYFRKAIVEAGEEWAQHKKLYDTGGNVRGTVPPGFSYFACAFGVQAGYATVIEDEANWPRDFGRDVLEGILEHPDAGIPLARRRKEPFERVQQRVKAVTEAFRPFDWTQQL